MPAFAVIFRRMAGTLAIAVAAAPCSAYEISSGFERIDAPDTTIEALHRLHFGWKVSPTFSIGQSIYSAADGDAGGAFFWGYEAKAEWPLGERLGLWVTGFIGGGGGAAQVKGDGLMLRGGLGVSYVLRQYLRADIGFSGLTIEGGDEAAKSLYLGLSWGGEDHASRASPRIGAVSVRAHHMLGQGSLTRSDTPQQDFSLIGVELVSPVRGKTDIFLAADGAAKGAEGYMQVIGGLRHSVRIGPINGITEAGVGFGGGGDVDTGGGLLLSGAAGLSLPVADHWQLALMSSYLKAPEGHLSSKGIHVRIERMMASASGKSDPSRRMPWRISTGLTQQFPGQDFRRQGVRQSGAPLMQETTFDFFVTQNAYATGSAQTVLQGDAAGYAIGLIGAGYRFSEVSPWEFGVEARLGAAGGGGVDTRGGAVFDARVKASYKLNDRLAIGGALGQMGTLSGGGMSPTYIHIGVTISMGETCDGCR